MADEKWSVHDWLAEVDEAILTADGFDEAILGFGERCGQPPIVVYDRERCVEILTEKMDGNREEAEEFFEFNTVGAWVGDRTPLFLVRQPDEYDPPQTLLDAADAMADFLRAIVEPIGAVEAKVDAPPEMGLTSRMRFPVPGLVSAAQAVRLLNAYEARRGRGRPQEVLPAPVFGEKLDG